MNEGLSLVHISPQPSAVDDNGVYVEVWEGGNIVEVVYESAKGKRTPSYARRGKVKGFSRSSKLRLLRKVSKVRTDAPAVFATLTYPASYPDVQTAKRHLNAIGKRLLRLGQYGFFWRFEYQRRGAPHFHLIVYGVKHVHRFRRWLAQAWYEVCGSGQVEHLSAGTQADWVRTHRGVMHYAAKYLSKTGGKQKWDSETGEVSIVDDGRQWGIVGRQHIPWAEMVRVIISTQAGYRLGRMLGHVSEYYPLFLGRVAWFFGASSAREIEDYAYNGSS